MRKVSIWWKIVENLRQAERDLTVKEEKLPV